MADTVIIEDAVVPPDTGYRFSWGLAIAGGVIATAVTFFLLTLGAGFGLMLVSPHAGQGASAGTVIALGATYFFAAQAFGFAVGGHIAGRLMGDIVETNAQEKWRSAAHGLVAWAVAILATLTMVAVTGLSAANAGATTAALYGAASRDERADEGAAAYQVDRLFRPADAAVTPAPVANSPGNSAARDEAARILNAGAMGVALSGEDRARLTALTANQAGLAGDAAAARVQALETEAKAAADAARKAAAYVNLWLAASLLFGAIVAMASAVYARIEDDRSEGRLRRFGFAR